MEMSLKTDYDTTGKLYRKIDVYHKGDYLFSTNQFATIRSAKAFYTEYYRRYYRPELYDSNKMDFRFQ